LSLCQLYSDFPDVTIAETKENSYFGREREWEGRREGERESMRVRANILVNSTLVN